MTDEDLRRGEIYWVDWSPARGSEQAGRRPALIVQTDAANSNERYPNTIVAAISRSGRTVSTHIPIEPSAVNGLNAPSFIKCEQIQTISKQRLDGRIGELTSSEMARVSQAIKRAMSLR